MATETSPTIETPPNGPPSPQRDIAEQVSSRLSKRLSLNFPILPPNGTQSGRASPSPRTSVIDPFAHVPITPTTSSGFLTALAGQERRVLELREELQRAEADLSNLKKKWATHEAQKKRSGVQDAELQAVKIDASKLDRDLVEESMGLSLLSREQETRSTSKEGSKQRPRKVFSGSRHTRTLSLLSPNATNIRSSFPQPESPEKDDAEAAQDNKPTLSRSSTLSEIQPQIQHPQQVPPKDTALKRRSMPPPSRDALLRTSKQMATDFREGLWTFFEDLRQATVGEEGINGTESRTAAPTRSTTKSKSPRPRPHKSHSSPRSVATGIGENIDPSLRVVGCASKVTSVLGSGEGRQSAIIDVGNDFWKEYGVTNQSPHTSPNRPRTSRQAIDLGPTGQLKSDDYDNWDAWDSPLAKPRAKDSSPASTAGTFSTQRDSPPRISSMSSPPTTSSPKSKSSHQRNFSRPKSNVSPSKDVVKEERRSQSPSPSPSPGPASYDNALQWALNG